MSYSMQFGDRIIHIVHYLHVILWLAMLFPILGEGNFIQCTTSVKIHKNVVTLYSHVMV